MEQYSRDQAEREAHLRPLAERLEGKRAMVRMPIDEARRQALNHNMNSKIGAIPSVEQQPFK